jgi:hypothetical protein
VQPPQCRIWAAAAPLTSTPLPVLAAALPLEVLPATNATEPTEARPKAGLFVWGQLAAWQAKQLLQPGFMPLALIMEAAAGVVR